MTDLHAQLLAEVDRLLRHLVDCASCSTCESAAGYRALRTVVELAHESQAPAVDGGYCDVDTIRPAELLQVIADALGVTDEEIIEKGERRG